MTTSSNKNPLRQLATAIVQACQKDGAKGVKQSTVLNALTKSEGFRSIQGSDAAFSRATPSHDKQKHNQISYIQGVIYANTESSDLLPFEPLEHMGQTMNAQYCADPLFALLWNQAAESPECIVDYTLNLRKKLEQLLDVIDGFSTWASSNRPEKYLNIQSDYVQKTLKELSFPAAFQRFLETEFKDSGEDCDNPNYMGHQALCRVSGDVEMVADALANDSLVSTWRKPL